MNDDRLIRALQALDRPIAVDAAFADGLFERLRAERRTGRRRLPLFLLAATLLIGASLGAALVGGGGPQPSEDPSDVRPVRQTWDLTTSVTPIRLEYAIPSDLDLLVSEGGAYIAFNPRAGGAYVLDGRSANLPSEARGVKVTDVAGATVHYSNDRPLGADAASFLTGLGTHPIPRAVLSKISSTSVGATEALTADLLSVDPEAHLDKDGGMIELWPPSRLVVADVGDAVVFIQIWAVTPEGLAEWLPMAERLVDSFRFAAATR